MFLAASRLLGAFASSPAPVVAQPVHATADDAQPKAPRGRKPLDPNKVICKSDVVIGSRTNVKKTCHTRAEWQELEGGTRKSVRDFQREGRANGTLGS